VGWLRHDATGALRTLATRSVVGRTPVCTVRSADPRVSSEHAVVAWADGRWSVRDLGSRNGTFVDDRRLAPGDAPALVRGTRIRFADDAWTLDDDSAPAPAAIELATGARISTEGDVLLLPDADRPEVSIAPTATGAWCAVSDDATWDVGDLDTVLVGGRRFQLSLPTRTDPTVGPDVGLELVFVVSSDEEQVEVEVSSGARTARFGPKSHHYLLLTLARQRLAQPNRSAAERGWVQRDDLARMLRLDPRTVNVQVHRVRQELGRHQLEGAAGLLEVRPRTGQIRVSTDRITIR
jgi:hypothetical protein